MFERYRISQKTAKFCLDEATLCPLYKHEITLSILGDAQHDGHLWSVEYCDKEEDDLCNQIMDKLKPIVQKIVKDANPYSIHK